MRFRKEKIIITDPCYLIREENKYQDRKISEYGTRLDKLGIIDFMVSDTGIGDGIWGVYTTSLDLSYIKDCLEKSDEDSGIMDDLLKESKKVGSYAADSGQTCVVVGDEIMKYNPDFFAINPTCFTELRNDSGFDVEFYKVSGVLHTVGVSGDGSLKFFTY